MKSIGTKRQLLDVKIVIRKQNSFEKIWVGIWMNVNILLRDGQSCPGLVGTGPAHV